MLWQMKWNWENSSGSSYIAYFLATSICIFGRKKIQWIVCHQVDSLEHKFLYCQIAEKYWKRVKNIAAKLTGETIEITAENILFTELVTTVSLHVNCRVIQLLSLLGKWSIHKCWVTGMNTPIEIILKNEFVLRYNFEKEVHKRVDVLEVFEQIVNLM